MIFNGKTAKTGLAWGVARQITTISDVQLSVMQAKWEGTWGPFCLALQGIWMLFLLIIILSIGKLDSEAIKQILEWIPRGDPNWFSLASTSRKLHQENSQWSRFWHGLSVCVVSHRVKTKPTAWQTSHVNYFANAKIYVREQPLLARYLWLEGDYI